MEPDARPRLETEIHCVFFQLTIFGVANQSVVPQINEKFKIWSGMCELVARIDDANKCESCVFFSFAFRSNDGKRHHRNNRRWTMMVRRNQNGSKLCLNLVFQIWKNSENRCDHALDRRMRARTHSHRYHPFLASAVAGFDSIVFHQPMN